MQAPYWFGAVGFVVLAGISALADHRRSRRRNLDRVGWVPWPLVLILSILAGAICAAWALKS